MSKELKEKLDRTVKELTTIYDIIYEQAVALYDKRGQDAVITWGYGLNLPSRYCIDCESDVPVLINLEHLEQTCIVCGGNGIW